MLREDLKEYACVKDRMPFAHCLVFDSQNESAERKQPIQGIGSVLSITLPTDTLVWEGSFRAQIKDTIANKVIVTTDSVDYLINPKKVITKISEFAPQLTSFPSSSFTLCADIDFAGKSISPIFGLITGVAGPAAKLNAIVLNGGTIEISSQDNSVWGVYGINFGTATNVSESGYSINFESKGSICYEVVHDYAPRAIRSMQNLWLVVVDANYTGSEAAVKTTKDEPCSNSAVFFPK